MDGIPDWQSDAGYARLHAIDRAGLMWEWLRRDPGYVAWHATASLVTHGAAPIDTAGAWGLYFRRKADPRRP